MCGIVGTAGNLAAIDEKIFTELLYADVVRGKHATGVAVVKGQCRQVNVHKRALAAPLYLELGSTTAHLSSFIQNTVVLGHNRHATKGSSSDPEGAHPFQHGHITLVHNGSLTSHYSLTDDNFTVDSEAICKAISVDGIEAVAPKLRGAFALVWINSEDNTLNFLRNEERCFAMAWNESLNRMWWASEMDMLKWQLNRDTFTRSPVVTTACFELPVGKWISIPITPNSINISGRLETELDVSDSVAPVYTGYNYTRGYIAPKQPTTPVNTVTKSILETQATSRALTGETVTDFKFGVSRENALKKLTAAVVSERGLNNFMIRSFVSSLDMNADAALLDERIGLFITHWDSYTATTSKLGTMCGQMMEYPYANVILHGFTESEYDEVYFKSEGMVTAYLAGFVTPLNSALTVKQGSLMEQEDLLKFSLVLRKDSLRKADLQDFYWDINQMPAEDYGVVSRVAKIEETEEPLDLELVVSNEPPGPTDPLRVFELADGTKVSPGGTAIFIGSSSALQPNLRYKITRIDSHKTDENILLTSTLNGDTYVYSSDKWDGGTLSKEADTEDTVLAVIGPDGEYIPAGKWQVAVSKGCCHCDAVPTDPEIADTLTWMGNRFTCEICYFNLANVGFSI